jgi:type I site-specific restriction endonuclease
MPNLTPEQKAREKIDRQLEQAGWLVQSYREMNIYRTHFIGVSQLMLEEFFDPF